MSTANSSGSTSNLCMHGLPLDDNCAECHVRFNTDEPMYSAAQVAALLKRAAEIVDVQWKCGIMALQEAILALGHADAIAALAKAEREAEARAFERVAEVIRKRAATETKHSRGWTADTLLYLAGDCETRATEARATKEAKS